MLLYGLRFLFQCLLKKKDFFFNDNIYTVATPTTAACIYSDKTNITYAREKNFPSWKNL